MFVGVLVLVDVFTLSLWTGMDSQSRTLQNGTLQVNNSILVNLQIHTIYYITTILYFDVVLLSSLLT